MHAERLGPYTLLSVVGSGGFGTVYRASDPEGSVIALKVLAPHEDNTETIKRFEREGTIRIEHPNVVRVLGAGRDGSVAYIALELLEGRPLTARLKGGVLTAEEVVDLGAQVADGLHAAHSRGVVHRDLKPGNVFCCSDGTVKVLDFGIARPMTQVGPHLTMAGSVVGTPGYLSPEQARGEREVGPGADVWSIGVILYQALTGVNPFMRVSAVATILAVVLEDAPLLPDTVAPGLAAIVHRCLQKDPSARWAGAEELARALREVDLGGASESAQRGPDTPTLPEDERRVVALLLASPVADLNALRAAVQEWGGQLTPIVGGAIGVFGGQASQGDEARCAVRAGLTARSSAGFMAVALGRADLTHGTIGGGALRAVEQAIQAQATGVALELAAARALRGEFELRPTQRSPIVEARLEHARDSGAFPVIRPDLPLFGRDGVIQELTAFVGSALSAGASGVVRIGGPPGIGKSRLRAEVEADLTERGVAMLSARGESHKRNAAFHLLRSVLMSDHALRSLVEGRGATREERRRRLRELLKTRLGDAQWARRCAAPLADLLGISEPIDPGATRAHQDAQLLHDRLRVALADCLSERVERQPLAIIVDDGQWADVSSLRLLDELLTRHAERPLVLVVATRGRLGGEAEAALFAGRRAHDVELAGLEEDDVRALATAIADEPVSREVARRVTARTEGNPFFVEQIVRAMADQGSLAGQVDELPLPVDVQGAVQSRLDCLPADLKTLAKRAAVLGDRFSREALAALSPGVDVREKLGALADRSLIVREARASTARRYRFQSELVRDVAYRMNAEDTRVELHRRAARFFADAGGSDPEELAHHYRRGRDNARAGESYVDATFAAASRGDSRTVLRCAAAAAELHAGYERALDLALARAEAHSFLGERAAERVALDEASALETPGVDRARVLIARASHFAAVLDHGAALEAATLAEREARQLDADLTAIALARRGSVLLSMGHVGEGSAAIETACLVPGVDETTRASLMSWRGLMFTMMGDLGKRKVAYEDAVARFRSLGDLRRAASAECNLADTLNHVGAYEEAEEALRATIETCRLVDDPSVEGLARVNLGYAQAGQERYDEALATLTRARSFAAQGGQPRLALVAALYHERTRVAAGDQTVSPASAARLAEEAQAAGIPSIAASALAVCSRAARASGDLVTALEAAEGAMRLRDEIGTLESDEAEIFLALAEATEANGQPERARETISRGANRLEFLAGRIEDASWRARFLSEVPNNRRLIELDGAA